jgi:hypothetical protein
MSAPSNAIAALYTPASMTAEQYDEIIRRLEGAGAGAPPGRVFHVCFGPPSDLRVLDLYDSPESMQAFGQSLLPILGQVGVQLARPPEVAPIHNVVDALQTAAV